MKISNSEEKHIGNSKNRTTTCSYTTNWVVAGGSLDDAVNFETSDSLTDSGSVVSINKPLLVLKPPTSESEPCEITLTFSQKHEIRQVYVRSTAHVYEIYYKPALLVSNEYLCTVRCSIVDIGAELHCASDDKEAVFIVTNGSDGKLSEKKSPSESNVSTNEDDWVEVKSPELPVDVISSLPTDIIFQERSLQDFYEATAQISDAEPSATLTLRLLSLEDKGCVYVDEVYVFADPVESTDTENQAAQTLHVGNAAGSSLMTMLIPTLLHLPRSNVGQSQEHASNKLVEKQRTDERARNNDSTNNIIEHDKKSNNTVQLDVKLEEAKGVNAQAAVQFPAPVLEKEGQYCSAADCVKNVGGVMEQLLSRVSRIEDLFLKFEEKMVKPINSMEERLQRVERQLDVIVKNTVSSGIPSCTRFSAPAFSSLDSTSSSLYNDSCAIPPCVQSEVEKHETRFDDVSKSSVEDSKSTSAPLFTPSLVITVPDFSCGEEDEHNDVVLKDSPCEKQKQPLSVGDAFAAAAAITGFSSMTIVEPLKHSLKFIDEENGTNEDSKCTQTSTVSASESSIDENACDKPLKYTEGLKFTAPDFLFEDNGYDDKVVSPRIENENLVHPSDSFATDGGEIRLESISAASDDTVLKRQETKQIQSDVGLQFCEGHRDGNSQGTTNHSLSARANDEFTYTGESSNKENKLSVLDRFEILRQLLAKTEDGDDSTKKSSGASFRNDENGYGNDVPSLLDFGTPILEVKFASLGNSGSRLPLEKLLTSETKFHTYVRRSHDADITMKASDLSSVPDQGRMTMQGKDLLLVDIESYDAAVSSETEAGLRDPLGNKQEEKFASLI